MGIFVINSCAQISKQAGPLRQKTAGIPQVGTDENRYRVMDETTSPNGHYAIALGAAKTKIDWKEYFDPNFGGYGLDPDRDEKILRNYVVNLENKHILGDTGGKFFFTKSGMENHHKLDVKWSADSQFFAQTVYWKWFSTCNVGAISKEGMLAGTLDLTGVSEKEAYKYLAKNKKEHLLKQREELAVTVDVVNWEKEKASSNDWVIEIDFIAEIPKSMEDGESAELTERFRITKDLRAELIDIQFAK